jgi:dTMP kinase
MTTRGKFITFEGCDGSGKSTQLKLLSDYLELNHIPHLFTREPGGGKISEEIRQIILDNKNAEMTDECEALLYAAARVQHLKDRVEPSLAQGKLVICDRYIDSSLAYQAGGRGLAESYIRGINAYAIEKYSPDVTIFIDLTPEEAFQRKHGADANDRMEQAGIEFHRKVYAAYKTLAAQESERIVTINGRATPEEMFQAILRTLRARHCF